MATLLPLRDLRAQRGDTVARLAASLGLDPGHLSRIERGRRGASPGLLVRIVRHYALSDAEAAALLQWAAKVSDQEAA